MTPNHNSTTHSFISEHNYRLLILTHTHTFILAEDIESLWIPRESWELELFTKDSKTCNNTFTYTWQWTIDSKIIIGWAQPYIRIKSMSTFQTAMCGSKQRNIDFKHMSKHTALYVLCVCVFVWVVCTCTCVCVHVYICVSVYVNLLVVGLIMINPLCS